MDLNKYIFREYDIRGKVSDDFPPDVVESLGKGFGTFIKRGGGQEIALSGDVRLTTPDLIQQFKTAVLNIDIPIEVALELMRTSLNSPIRNYMIFYPRRPIIFPCFIWMWLVPFRLQGAITHRSLMVLKCPEIKKLFLVNRSKISVP